MSDEEIGVRVRKLLRDVFEADGFGEATELTLRPGAEMGDGYIAIKHAIDVRDGDRVLRLFSKTAPKDDVVRSQLLVREMFCREIRFYASIYPEFVRFQKERGVAAPFKSVAKCYATSDDHYDEAVILDNLKEQGYTLCNRMATMPREDIATVFKMYAGLHAISFAMKDQEPEKYAKLSADLTDLSGPFYTISRTDIIIGHYSEETRKLFHPDSYVYSRIENLAERMVKICSEADEYIDEYSVITHGDCWCNNFMYKYKDPNNYDVLEDVKMIDLQLIRLNSPVLDLVFFFYSVADKKSLDDFEFFKRTYHQALSENIQAMGSDPEKLYPYAVFDDHWRRFSRYGLSMSFVVLRVMLAYKEETANAMEAFNSGQDFGDSLIYEMKNEAVYWRRITDIVEHFVYNNFI